jgi:integrase/recombinase XerD
VSCTSCTGLTGAWFCLVDVVIYRRPSRRSPGVSMLVQRVVMPASRVESWTVLGEDAAPVGPIERYLAYLTDIERSPNTIKAYAHDLKDWFTFLGQRGLDWCEVRLEDVGEFVAWLRRPPEVRDGKVVVLPSVGHHCGESTVNRKLTGGVGVLSARCPARRRSG